MTAKPQPLGEHRLHTDAVRADVRATSDAAGPRGAAAALLVEAARRSAWVRSDGVPAIRGLLARRSGRSHPSAVDDRSPALHRHRPGRLRGSTAAVDGPLPLAGHGLGSAAGAGRDRGVVVRDGTAPRGRLVGALDRSRHRRCADRAASEPRPHAVDVAGITTGPLTPCLHLVLHSGAGSRLRHSPRHLRAAAQRRAGGRRRADAGMDRVPPPGDVPDLRRHGGPAAGRQRAGRDSCRRLVEWLRRLRCPPAGDALREGAAVPRAARASSSPTAATR